MLRSSKKEQKYVLVQRSTPRLFLGSFCTLHTYMTPGVESHIHASNFSCYSGGPIACNTLLWALNRNIKLFNTQPYRKAFTNLGVEWEEVELAHYFTKGSFAHFQQWSSKHLLQYGSDQEKNLLDNTKRSLGKYKGERSHFQGKMIMNSFMEEMAFEKHL